MEPLYNPDLMSEDDIKRTFVGRQALLDDLLSLLERQPQGAGVQHVLLIAPRGMGKTTMLLMLGYAVRDSGLSERWQPIRFREESYGVTDLADFWLEAVFSLAAEVGDRALALRAEGLREEHPNSDTLCDAALALLKQWSREHGKRLVLLVDNLDMLLEQMSDEREAAQLRSVLMNDGTAMLVGGATTYFREARDYDQPLYNFFRVFRLERLALTDIKELLRRRAQVDGRQDIEQTLEGSAGRLRALEYFTGGSPRLVLMLYNVIARSEVLEVREGLEKLLDEVTPYYKAKIESLSPQHRKILDHIARISGETQEGVTPADIAAQTRLPPNQVSAQLKRLADLGYVRSANIKGRRSYYTLSEPLYAIWHQMRFGRDARQRMRWLVDFLRAWYDSEEMASESTRLAVRFEECLRAGLRDHARDLLEHRRYIVEAMRPAGVAEGQMDGVVRDYLRLGDLDGVQRELLAGSPRPPLSLSTAAELLRVVAAKAGCGQSEEQPAAEAVRALDEGLASLQEAVALWTAGDGSAANAKADVAADAFGRLCECALPEWTHTHGTPGETGAGTLASALLDLVRLLQVVLGSMYHLLNRYEEALAACDRALYLQPDDADAWHHKGIALSHLNRHEEALAAYDRVLQLQPDDAVTWCNKGVTLGTLDRSEEALAAYDRALRLQPDDAVAWCNKGLALGDLNRSEEALAAFGRALQLQPDDAVAWYGKGVVLAKLFRYDEALAAFGRTDAASEGRPVGLPVGFLTFRVRLAASAGSDVQVLAAWRALVSSVRGTKEAVEVAAEAVRAVASSGRAALARQLIADAELEEELLPLARALDSVLTGNEAVIEKLSPEVRGIAREIADTIRKALPEGGEPPRQQARPKRRAGSRGRSHKQLG